MKKWGYEGCPGLETSTSLDTPALFIDGPRHGHRCLLSGVTIGGMTTSPDGAVRFTLPAPDALQLLATLDAYAKALESSPAAWIDDDEISQRSDDAQRVRGMLRLLTPQVPNTRER